MNYVCLSEAIPKFSHQIDQNYKTPAQKTPLPPQKKPKLQPSPPNKNPHQNKTKKVVDKMKKLSYEISNNRSDYIFSRCYEVLNYQ